ncbi:MAG: hypothetical protein AB1791_04690 [Chloroflexota bacterium]
MVLYKHGVNIINRRGQPARTVTPLEGYESWWQQRQELFDLVRQFQQASGIGDPDEVMREVLEAQQIVRAAAVG